MVKNRVDELFNDKYGMEERLRFRISNTIASGYLVFCVYTPLSEGKPLGLLFCNFVEVLHVEVRAHEGTKRN